MIKQFSILLTLSAAAICAYAQSEIPTDVEIKLDEQAQKLFPEDARAQQRWLNTQKDSYLTLPYIVAADKEDENLFKSAAQTAEKLFPLDYEKRMKFLNDAAAALANITSYKSYFPAEEQKTYEKIKADCLSQNPEDYRKAAKDFEAKIQAVIELDAIPFPEMVDDALKSALKGAAARKFPNDYAKQKEYLSAWSDRFVNFSIYESERQAQEKQNAKGGGNISAKINDAFAKLKNQILKVKSESETLGYCIAIQNKPVVIFPSSGFNPREISIENKLSERVRFSDICASKDAPFIVAIIKNPSEDIQTLALANTEALKACVDKPAAFVYQDGNQPGVVQNTITAISNQTLQTSRKISKSYIFGSALVNPENLELLGMLVPARKFSDVPELSNKDNVNEIIRSYNKEKVATQILRLDTLKNWEKLDPAKYAQQEEDLKNLEARNLEFLAFLKIKTFSEMDSLEALSEIHSKYASIFAQRQDKTTQTRNIKNMLLEISSEMRKDIQRVKLDSLYFPLRAEYAYNIGVRNAIIAYIEKVARSGNMQNFMYKDIKVSN